MRQPDDKSWEEEHIHHLNEDIEVLSEKLKIIYCKSIGSDSTTGLDSCDDYKDWLNSII